MLIFKLPRRIWTRSACKKYLYQCFDFLKKKIASQQSFMLLLFFIKKNSIAAYL